MLSFEAILPLFAYTAPDLGGLGLSVSLTFLTSRRHRLTSKSPAHALESSWKYRGTIFDQAMVKVAEV